MASSGWVSKLSVLTRLNCLYTARFQRIVEDMLLGIMTEPCAAAAIDTRHQIPAYPGCTTPDSGTVARTPCRTRCPTDLGADAQLHPEVGRGAPDTFCAHEVCRVREGVDVMILRVIKSFRPITIIPAEANIQPKVTLYLAESHDGRRYRRPDLCMMGSDGISVRGVFVVDSKHRLMLHRVGHVSVQGPSASADGTRHRHLLYATGEKTVTTVPPIESFGRRD